MCVCLFASVVSQAWEMLDVRRRRQENAKKNLYVMCSGI